MDKQHLIGFGLAILGIGFTAVGRLLKMEDSTKQALGGVGIAMMVLGIGVIFYGSVAETDSGKVSTPTSITQTNPHNSPSVSGSGNTTIYNMDQKKEDRAEPTTLGKYVCTTDLPAKDGKHALLVEFGVRRGQTDGFYGEVHFVDPYEKREAWVGAPLRTDKQEGMLIQMGLTTREKPDHSAYAESFASPTVTSHRSYYLYFEAKQPLRLKGVAFIEDPQSLSDQIRANRANRMNL
jgi:hypothetical protein